MYSFFSLSSGEVLTERACGYMGFVESVQRQKAVVSVTMKATVEGSRLTDRAPSSSCLIALAALLTAVLAIDGASAADCRQGGVVVGVPGLGRPVNLSNIPLSELRINLTQGGKLSTDSFVYLIRLCGGIPANNPAPSLAPCFPGAAGAMVAASSAGQCASVYATVTGGPDVINSGISLSVASVANANAALSIGLVCDRAGPANGGLTPKSLEQVTATVFRLSVGTVLLCGEPPVPYEGFSWGLAFILLVLLGGASYVVGAVMWNLAHGKSGAGLAPHPEFWKDFPSLVMDGIKFTTSVCPCAQAVATKAGKKGYSAL